MTSIRTAVADGLLGRKTLLAQDIAAMGKQNVYSASTAQVRALHDAMPEHLPAADVDFIRGSGAPRPAVAQQATQD